MSAKRKRHVFVCDRCENTCSIVVVFPDKPCKVPKKKMPECIFSDATIKADWKRTI